jgi:hypothetical protein
LPPNISAAERPTSVISASVASNGIVEVKTEHPLRVVGELATWANKRDLDLPNLEVSRPTLEDIYLELTEDR